MSDTTKTTIEGKPTSVTPKEGGPGATYTFNLAKQLGGFEDLVRQVFMVKAEVILVDRLVRITDLDWSREGKHNVLRVEVEYLDTPQPEAPAAAETAAKAPAKPAS